MKKWSSDRIVSMTAIIVSLGTLFTIVYQTQLIRKQQYASVLPYLEQWTSDQRDSYSFLLLNKGLGPAFIKEVKVLYGDSTYEGGPAKFVYDIIKPIDSVKNYFYGNIKKGMLIPAGERFEMVASENDLKNAGILRSWFSQRDSVTLEIIYESVYGERWVTNGMATEPIKLN